MTSLYGDDPVMETLLSRTAQFLHDNHLPDVFATIVNPITQLLHQFKGYEARNWRIRDLREDIVDTTIASSGIVRIRESSTLFFVTFRSSVQSAPHITIITITVLTMEIRQRRREVTLTVRGKLVFTVDAGVGKTRQETLSPFRSDLQCAFNDDIDDTISTTDYSENASV